MFPKLDDAQIARLEPFGQKGDVEAGAVISGFPAIDNRAWLKSSAVFTIRVAS